MSKAAEMQALRKQLLLARSNLYRLKIRYQLDVIRADMRWPRVLVSLAAAPPARSALLGLIALVVGSLAARFKRRP
jgi:hypothetical protein